MQVTHFMRRPRANVFSLERLYEDVRGAIPVDCHVKVWTCRNPSTGLWPRLKDLWAARRAQGDVNHVTGDVHYLTFLLDPERTVLTIADLVSLDRLHGIRRWLLWLLWYWLPVRRSRFIVTISEATRAALLNSVRCDPARVTVIHCNVSEEFRPLPRPFNVRCPRILQVGTKPNKNLERVAAALEDVNCRLVIVGPLSEEQLVALRRHQIDYENCFGLSREELIAQYIAADMLIFASTFEGFGLPIVEAQAVGRPVVTSDLQSMPEVAGQAACFVDPFDVASIRAGVMKVIEDATYREQLIEKGYRNVERFRTASVAEHYAALYRKIANDLR
jgi:glycosyltransferase involved in cell wall biosynthesis